MKFSRHTISKNSWSGGLALILFAGNTAAADSNLVESSATGNVDVVAVPVTKQQSQLNDLIGLSGSIRSAYFTRDKSFSDNTGYAVGSVWMTATPKEFLGIKTYVDARAQNQNLSRNSNTSFDLREAYAQSTFGDIDIRLGRQITVWGRADKINPTDTWSTRDFRLLTSNDEDQRLGVTSVQSTWNMGTYHLIGLWQPEWRFPGLPTPPLPTGMSIQNISPTDSRRQFGLKLDHSGQGVDWSVSYAHAIDRTPDLAVLSSGPHEMQLGFRYQMVDVIGADAAVPVGNYGFRGELAYTRTKDRDGSDPLTKNSNLFAVLGCERTFGDALNVNVQYLFRRTFGFQDLSSISDPNIRSLAQQVDILSNQLAPNMQGASLRINYKAWNDTLEVELAALTWFNKGDLAMRPKLSYAFSDRFKVILGGEIYRGPLDTFFGRLSKVSSEYVEVQIGF